MAKSAIVIGAGIVGLATARALAVRGHKVTVLERNDKAIGASIRNFGMIWPIGQPDGILYERALISSSIWKEVCVEANIWFEQKGSLHVAHSDEEWAVLQELQDKYSSRNYCLLTPGETCQKSEVVVNNHLRGSLYSTDEMIVDPRNAIAKIPQMLSAKYEVKFLWGQAVTGIDHPAVYTAKSKYQADQVFLCTGADFEMLFPELFLSYPITKSKLQMMRMVAQPGQTRIGPALCGGLSLLHYSSFKVTSALGNLKKKFEQLLPGYLGLGIHVMVSQNETGELTVGDSHEYGICFDPFTKTSINEKILSYLKTFARFKDERIIESWYGIYLKLTDGSTEIILKPHQGLTIINGLGGAGMTLSFGLCEQIIAEI